MFREMSPRAGFVAALSSVALVLASLPAFAAGQATPTSNDLAALSYYHAHGQTAAEQAEIARLKSVFPGWSPPANLASLTQGVTGADIRAIYADIARGDLARASAGITKLKATTPDWQPPEEMMHLLALSKAQQGFDQAVASGDMQAAVALAHQNPTLMQCDRVNNSWRLAEGLAASGDSRQALVIYALVVGSCPSYEVAKASLQKASAIGSETDLATIGKVALARFPERDQETRDLLKGLLAGIAARSRLAGSQRLVPAISQPTTAAPIQKTHPAGHAYAVTAVGTNGCASVGQTGGSLTQLAQRGWCVYDLGRPLQAYSLFTKVAEGSRSSLEIRDAKFGMAISLLKMNMTEKAALVNASANFTPKQRLQVETGILEQRALSSYQRGEYRRTIGYIEGLENLTRHAPRDLLVLLGYSYLKLGDQKAAHSIFARLDAELSTKETRAGLNASS